MWTTKHIRLKYSPGQENPFKLTAASDASFADCEDTKRSTLGWCQWLGDKPNGLITWGSRIGKNVALSTTESEVQAALELTKDVLWTRDFMSEIGYLQSGSTRMFQDNNGCIGQANANKGLRRARHYLIALAALNEACQSGDIHMYRVDSDDNTADFFTKGLGGAKHTKFGSESQGRSLACLYKSRKLRDENPQEEEQNIPASALLASVKEEGELINPSNGCHSCQKEGELNNPANGYHSCKKEGERISSHANMVIIGEDANSPSITDGLRVTMEYTGGKGIKVDNNTNLDYQTVPMSRDDYLQIALKHADSGNESKFNMYFKAAKMVGHIQNLKDSYVTNT